MNRTRVYTDHEMAPKYNKQTSGFTPDYHGGEPRNKAEEQKYESS